MNATEQVVSSSATFLATVDLPDPEPPAIPIIKGLSILLQSYAGDVWNALCPPLKRLETLDGCPPMTNRSIVLAFILSLAACGTLSRGSGGAGGTDQNEVTAVQIENRGFADMTVYAVRSSQRVRLGIVPGHSTKVFDVPRTLMGGLTQLRFIADPIGATRRSVSEEITVAPGDTVVMTIPPS